MRSSSIVQLGIISTLIMSQIIALDDSTLVVRKRNYELDFTDYCKPV